MATMDQLNDGALELALQATHRFALSPRLWLDLANVCQLRGDRKGEIDALSECLRITPGWSTASRQLADALGRDGKVREARRVMKTAIARDALDGSNHASLAELLWRMNKHRAAIVHAKRAVLLEPELASTWERLRQWTARKRPEGVVNWMTVRRAGEARSWLILAQMLAGDATLDERLAASRRNRFR